MGIKKYWAKVLLLGLCVCLGADAYCSAENSVNSPDEVVATLKGNDLEKQEEVLNNLFDGEHRVKESYRIPRIQEALYTLLTLTTSPTEQLKLYPPPSLSEKILWTMGDYKELRAIPYLLPNIRKRGNIVLSLAKMGPTAINPVLGKLQHGDEREKSAACGYFEILFSSKSNTILVDGEIVSNPYRGIYTPTGAAKSKIRAEFRQLLMNKNLKQRRCGVKVLGLIGDPEDKQLLEDAVKMIPPRKTAEIKPEIIERERAKKAERKKMGLPEREPIDVD